MNHSEISSFIWGTADLLRSSFKQHEYGDIILPFTVMRRLDVVLEPTKDKVLEAAAKPIIDALRDNALKRAAGVNFYNTSKFTMSSLLADADGIRENLTQYVTSFSPMSPISSINSRSSIASRIWTITTCCSSWSSVFVILRSTCRR